MVQQSDVRGQESGGQASGDRLHFLGSTENPEDTEPGALDWKDYSWMQKKENITVQSRYEDETSPKILLPQHREDGLPSTLTEDADLRNLLTPGVDLNPSLSLSTKVKENHVKTFGKLGLAYFSIHSNMVRLRMGLHVVIIPNDPDS